MSASTNKAITFQEVRPLFFFLILTFSAKLLTRTLKHYKNMSMQYTEIFKVVKMKNYLIFFYIYFFFLLKT